MSMFNSDQRDYMRYLSRRPPESKCWCGWYDLGACPHCPPGKSAADKVAASCPKCRSAPPPDLSRPIAHAYKCPVGAAEESGATGDAREVAP